MSQAQDWNAHWRASAHEAVPYTDLFPEALLVLPELIDGAIGNGQAPRVEITVTIKDDKGVLTVSDNGIGIKSVNRLLSWTSSASTHTQHRYGHGSKKCLAKWNRDYTTAEWSLAWRNKDKKNISGSLQMIKAPFLGRDTPIEEDDKDETRLMPSGTCWTIHFDPTILGSKYSESPSLFAGIKEILRSRYSAAHFEKTEFVLRVNKKSESSRKNNWLTFEQCLESEVVNKNAYVRYNVTMPVTGGTMTYKQYQICADGRHTYLLKSEFPVMGQKNIRCTKVHTALDGRTIEPIDLYRILKKETGHNDYNGQYGIVNFIPEVEGSFETFPTPCTTKVSFYENCPNFKEFMNRLLDIHKGKPADMPKELAAHLKMIAKQEAEAKAAAAVAAAAVAAATVAPAAPAAPVAPAAPATTVVDTSVTTLAQSSLMNDFNIKKVKKIDNPVQPIVEMLKPSATETVEIFIPAIPSSPPPPPAVVHIPAHTKLVPQSQLNLLLKLRAMSDETKAWNWDELSKKATSSVDPGIANLVDTLEKAMKSVRGLMSS
jgi:hypothetical protein